MRAIIAAASRPMTAAAAERAARGLGKEVRTRSATTARTVRPPTRARGPSATNARAHSTTKSGLPPVSS